MLIDKPFHNCTLFYFFNVRATTWAIPVFVTIRNIEKKVTCTIPAWNILRIWYSYQIPNVDEIPTTLAVNIEPIWIMKWISNWNYILGHSGTRVS